MMKIPCMDSMLHINIKKSITVKYQHSIFVTLTQSEA